MDKSYQGLLNIMSDLLVTESEQLCRQVAAVFQRFHPEAMYDLQNMINEWKYGPSGPQALNNNSQGGQELVLTRDDFKKKIVGADVVKLSNQQNVIHSGIVEEIIPQKMPTKVIESVEDMYEHFSGMKLKEIKRFMNDNGVPVHSAANADAVLEILNAAIK